MMKKFSGIFIAGLFFLMAGSAQAQDARSFAMSTCVQALAQRMSQEVGGRSPYAKIDPSTMQFRQVSASKVELSGTGDYRRDYNDRGLPFNFNCVVSMQNEYVANLNYTWQNFSGKTRPKMPDYDQGYENHNYGSNYNANGRVWFSGGILNRNSGKGVDVRERSQADSANIQQWDYQKQPNQTWDIVDLGNGEYSIISHFSNKVLDVYGGGRGDGANVVQYRWHNGENQRWRIQRTASGFYHIINVGSGKCLEVSQRSVQDGANIQQGTCMNGAPQQEWKFEQ
ncbi:MAG: RICIN domain-containing protein [Blastocatellales bacterium]|mgnify:CR=1 FL=1